MPPFIDDCEDDSESPPARKLSEEQLQALEKPCQPVARREQPKVRMVGAERGRLELRSFAK